MPMQFDSGGYKPQFELSALYGGMENAMAEDAHNEEMMKNKIANFLAAQKAPNEIMESNLKGFQAQGDMDPAFQAARQAGRMGEFGSAEAKGKVALGTADSDITAGIAKNKAEASDKGIETFMNEADAFIASGGNPFAMSKSGMSPERIKEFTQLYQSGQLAPILDNMKKQYTDSVKQRQAIGAAAEKGRWDVKQAGVTVQGQKDLEQMRIDAGKYAKANSDKITIFTSKLKPEVQLAQINASLTGNKDPVTGEPLDEAGRNFWTMYGRSLGASAELKVKPQEGVINVPQVSGLPAVATPQAIVPGAPPQQPKSSLTPEERAALIKKIGG